VLITPHDIAGQMGILARALRSIGVDARSVQFGRRTGYLQFELDETVELSGGRARRLVRAAAAAQQLVRDHDVLHYFFGRTMVPGLVDARLARRLGKPVFVHFRGRDVSTVRLAVELSGSTPSGRRSPSRASAAQVELVARWRRTADQLLISTPDLWREVPDATWVPQAIELDAWPYRPKSVQRGATIVVGHAPTSPVLKGTAFVEEAVDSLRRRGLDVELDLITGVPPGEVRARMERCHLGVDQVVQGAYGNVTIQFMALGRPTVNFLDPIYAERGIDVPTVHATPDSLADDLLRLLDQPGEMAGLAERGREHVESVHRADVVAARLRDLYDAALSA
jgi:glycosyltransferase involved in cell wall biosynthesis